MIITNITLQQRIGIYISPRTSINKVLIDKAVEHLVSTGQYHHTTLHDKTPTTIANPLLAIDGTEDNLSFHELVKTGNTPTFHLVVSELGITNAEGVPFTEEELQLVLDAVEACCTIPDITPKFNCPCSR